MKRTEKYCATPTCRVLFTEETAYPGQLDGSNTSGYCRKCHRIAARETMRKRTGYYDRNPGVSPVQQHLGDIRKLNDVVLEAVRARHKKELEAVRNYHTGVVEGFVYVVSNPAWQGWVKIGCAVDPEDRANSYQTSSPFRDFKLEGYAYSTDRRASERAVHTALAKHRHGGEWFLVPIQEAIETVKKICSLSSTGG